MSVFQIVHQKIVPVGLMIALIISAMSSSIVHLSFAVNQGYIANTLCIDRDVEDSSCNGKCYLKQKINKEEKKQEDPVKNMNSREFSFIWHTVDSTPFINPPVVYQAFPHHFESSFSSGYTHPHERPPCYFS